jgi:integrase/recombinase XerD
LEAATVTQETQILEPDELEALLGTINTRTPSGARNYALLQLMAETGVRVSEALNIKPSDIREEDWPTNSHTVRVWVLRLPRHATKGQQARQGIPLSPATRQAVDRWQEKRKALGIRGGPLFCTITEGKLIHGAPTAEGFAEGKVETKLEPGRPLSRYYVHQLLKRLAKRAGITTPLHAHVLRHTALTALYDRTQDLRLVQHVAGHTTTRMTERYTHVHPIELARAMGALEDPQAEGRAQALALAAKLAGLPAETRKAIAALIGGDE